MQDLSNVVAVVTGAASGIGRSTFELMISQGACVVGTDINEDAGLTLAETLGEKAAFIRHDVSDESDWIRVIAFADKRFGGVNALVNNAGIIAPGNNEGPIEDLSIENARRVIEVNQVGCLLGVKHVVPLMKRAGHGSIVNMSSSGGLVGTPFLTAYSATKWAVTGMTKCLAIELGRFGIRVNSVHPGAIWTPIHYRGQQEDQAKSTREWVDSVAQMLPLPRVAEPIEVARMIAFLVSDHASYSTGASFVIDGGLTAM